MLISEMKVVRPGALGDALALLAEHGEGARPLAGGTDAMVRVKEGKWRVPVWVEVRRLPDLLRITVGEQMVTVGAAVPYGRIITHEGLRQAAPLLVETAADIGAVQIQAMGTIGGNLGTASPAGDAVCALHALEAEVGLASRARGERWVPVEQFCLGPGSTVRRPDELITAVRFPRRAPGERWLWQKLGLRGAQAIAVVSLAMRVQPGGAPGTVAKARFAFGAVGPVVMRARRAERALVSTDRPDEGMLRSVGQLAWGEVAPITDVRGPAEYRRAMAAALLQRGLLRLLGREGER